MTMVASLMTRSGISTTRSMTMSWMVIGFGSPGRNVPTGFTSQTRPRMRIAVALWR